MKFWENGFYLEQNKENSRVQITDEEWQNLLNAQSNGKEIVTGENGRPVAIEHITTDEEKSKVEVLKGLLEEDDIFFSLDVSAAFGILNFLGIPDDKLESTYYQLISYNNYLNSMPKYEVDSLNDTLH